MKKLPLALAALAAFGTGAAEARYRPLPGAPERRQPAPADCSLSVAFGSYAMGIDRAAFTAVERLLGSDRGVRAVTRGGWGREGEVTLCVRARSRADANRLFAAVRARIPARPRGPVTIRLAGGRSWQTPPPRR